MQTLRQCKLWYKAGTSDKVYNLEIIEDNGLYCVNFAYGRRGSNLKCGSKIAYTGLAIATKVYNEVLNEKTGKGYQITSQTNGTSTVTFNPSAGPATINPAPTPKPSRGPMCQLLTPIDLEKAAEYIKDDNFWMQEKYDGKRLLIEFPKFPSKAIAINRKGIEIEAPDELLEDIKKLSEKYYHFIIDGEYVNGKYYVFDVIALEEKDMRHKLYYDRNDILEDWIQSTTNVVLSHVYVTTEEKQQAFDSFMKSNKEGVVFKRKTSYYQAGRNDDQLKCKFWSSASCLVSIVNEKRSVGLALYDAKGNPQWQEVGNVTIPANHEIPRTGDIVEIKYLYAYKGGSLYQSIYLGKRTDIELDDCTVAQLKYKAI